MLTALIFSLLGTLLMPTQLMVENIGKITGTDSTVCNVSWEQDVAADNIVYSTITVTMANSEIQTYVVPPDTDTYLILLEDDAEVNVATVDKCDQVSPSANTTYTAGGTLHAHQEW